MRKIGALLLLMAGCARPGPAEKFPPDSLAVVSAQGGAIAYPVGENATTETLEEGTRVRVVGPSRPDKHLPVRVLDGKFRGLEMEIWDRHLAPVPSR